MEKPEMKITAFNNDDVITTSGNSYSLNVTGNDSTDHNLAFSILNNGVGVEGASITHDGYEETKTSMIQLLRDYFGTDVPESKYDIYFKQVSQDSTQTATLHELFHDDSMGYGNFNYANGNYTWNAADMFFEWVSAPVTE